MKQILKSLIGGVLLTCLALFASATEAGGSGSGCGSGALDSPPSLTEGGGGAGCGSGRSR